MDETRTSRHLPIRDKIAECEEALESVHQINHKINHLITLEKLIALKRTTANL